MSEPTTDCLYFINHEKKKTNTWSFKKSKKIFEIYALLKKKNFLAKKKINIYIFFSGSGEKHQSRVYWRDRIRELNQEQTLPKEDPNDGEREVRQEQMQIFGLHLREEDEREGCIKHLHN